MAFAYKASKTQRKPKCFFRKKLPKPKGNQSVCAQRFQTGLGFSLWCHCLFFPFSSGHFSASVGHNPGKQLQTGSKQNLKIAGARSLNPMHHIWLQVAVLLRPCRSVSSRSFSALGAKLQGAASRLGWKPRLGAPLSAPSPSPSLYPTPFSCPFSLFLFPRPRPACMHPCQVLGTMHVLA